MLRDPQIAGDASHWSIFITPALWLNQNRHIPITPCKMTSRFPSMQANKEAYLSCHNYTLHFGVLREALLFFRSERELFASLDFFFFNSHSLGCSRHELNISICSKCVSQVYIAKHIKMNGLPLRDHCDFERGVGI